MGAVCVHSRVRGIVHRITLVGDDSDDDDDATSCGALEGESPTTETVHLRRLANIDVFKDSGNGNARGSRIGRKCNLCKKFLLFM